MNFHGGQLKKDGLIDFSVNIPHFPIDDAYKALLNRSFDQLKAYPEIDGLKARHALSEYLNWPMDQIILGNGATDLIYLMTRALKLERAMILEPTFTEYKRALSQSGTKVYEYVLEGDSGFHLNTDLLSKAINNARCDALFLCNPNNPTGQLFTVAEIESILEHVNGDHFLLVIDESFIEFKDRPSHHEAMKDLMGRYNILVMRSMTKTFCVPGLRIGYMFGSEKSIKLVSTFRDPWALNLFALESIPYFLKDDRHFKQLQDWCEEESAYMKALLSKLERVEVFDGHANFVLFKLNHSNPTQWHEALIEKGFYLRTCLDFTGLDAHYFRIAIKDRQSNKALMDAMKETLI
jgi:threonine-phosphate decarboxylase